MFILPVLIILRNALRYYTILILAGARYVPVIVIGELFIYFCVISPIILAGARHVPVIVIGELFTYFCVISPKNIEM